MKINELKKLYEQSPENYRETFSKLLGVEGKKRNRDSELNPYDFSLQEMAYEFLGRDYKTVLKDYGKYRASAEVAQLMEIGNVVLPSHFKSISAFDDSVAGLVNAVITEGYDQPDYVGSQFVTEESSNMNGGKRIGIRSEAGASEGQDLLPGESAPNVGLKSVAYNVPENRRRHQVLELNQYSIIYDLTSQVLQQASQLGQSIARAKERDIARLVQGITNNYSVDDVSGNTYLTTAGAGLHNFVNSTTKNLEDWTDLDEAMLLLQSNVSPFTGWEIGISPENMTLLVQPEKKMSAQTIIRSTEIRTSTNSGANVRLSENPLPSMPVVASHIWRNVLVEAGVSDIAYQWQLVNKRAFCYRTVIPFTVEQIQLSSEEARRGSVAFYSAYETGVAYVLEPRYSSLFTKAS